MASDVALLADHRDRTLPLKLPTIVPLRRLGGRMQPGAGDADSSAHPSSASSARRSSNTVAAATGSSGP